jgi:predicted alpha-1,2-mannosidase
MYQRGPSGRTCIAFYLLLWGTLWLRPLVLLAADPATWVNPFVGTKLSNLSDYGKTVPGAVRPFGMLNWGPDTAGVEFYQWEKPLTRGFSLTHTSGPGCGQFGDAPVFPLEGTPIDATEGPMTSSFRHEHEVAEPGYYSVVLDSGIHVQLAAQVRSGIAEFDFPSGTESHTLLFDLGHNLSPGIYATEITIHGRQITGSVTSGNNCRFGKNQYRMYFAFETQQTPMTSVVFDKGKQRLGPTLSHGVRAGGYVSFPTSVRTVRLRVGLSYVSSANAKANLKREIPGWDLQVVRQQARRDWDAALGHALAEGGDDRDRKVFYTALYHALLHPSVFSDLNGEYIGFDGKVHQAGPRIQYANFSGWDIYRCEVQLLAMLFPERASDMAQSLVVDAQQGGGLPIFPVANDEAHAMVGDPGDAILAGFYAFGARNFDVHAAWRAMLRGATDPQTRVKQDLERPYLEEYLKQGFVSDRNIPGQGAASMTLEYQNADFAISRMAAMLGDQADARKFLALSGRWRTLFDPETKYIRARDVHGNFLPDFSPASEAGFVEGNSAQYTWMVPYDLENVIQAIGGPDAASARLDHYFSQYYHGGAQSGPYFAIANEPSFGNPWVYNWTGRPWRTQEVVRKTLRDLFSPEPQGLPGNDDLGATSAWVVFAELGFYPEIPGVGGVTLHSPVFPGMTLLLGSHPLRITASGAPSQIYVQKVELDDRPVLEWWIDWDHLSRASHLSYVLGSHANLDPHDAPPSFPPPH